MAEFISAHWLDIITTILGLIYIWLEYKASIALWIVGIIMPALDVYLYWSHGLYGDAGMAVYYTLAAVYGYIAWKWYGHKHKNAKSNNEGKHELPITHIRTRHILPATAAFFIAWALHTGCSSPLPTAPCPCLTPLPMPSALSDCTGQEIHRAMAVLDCG